MAKSARASVVKTNHRKLRAKVFGPAHDARTARLSAKLQELAAQPKPEAEKPMDVDEKTEESTEDQPSNENIEEMDVDGVKIKPVKSRSEKHRANAKVHRVTKKKPRNSMVFPSEAARKRKMAAKKSQK